MGLLDYLGRHGRLAEIPVSYADLTRYSDVNPVYNRRGRDTLWQSVVYPASLQKHIFDNLARTYFILLGAKAIHPLAIERIDFCTYANNQPFRIKIQNPIDDSAPYFYIKRADASQIYGLELEALLTSNPITFRSDGVTLIEPHIVGVPGDQFIRHLVRNPEGIEDKHFAQEFIKFNERCFRRLLGDMHSGNYVVQVHQDFDNCRVRFCAIDFDQQSYEGRCNVYMPKYYPENNAIIFMGIETLRPDSARRYQEDEIREMRQHARSNHEVLADLLATMSADNLAPQSHLMRLRQELARHYRDDRFLGCKSMGDLVHASLSLIYWE